MKSVAFSSSSVHSGHLTVLMIPEPHDPDLPAAAQVNMDICFCVHVCVRPAQLELRAEETGVFSI